MSRRANSNKNPWFQSEKKIRGIGQVTHEIPEILVVLGKTHPEIPVILLGDRVLTCFDETIAVSIGMDHPGG